MIVILGVLATITVFAVRTITTSATVNACEAELDNLYTAQEVHATMTGGYGDEAALVAGGSLTGESDLYDVTLAGGEYTITPAAGSACTGSSSSGGGGGPPPPPPVPPTPIMFGSIPAWQYGAGGADEIVVFGRAEGEADWLAMIAAAPPTTRRVTFINMVHITSDTDVDYVMNRSRTNGVTDWAIYLDDDTSSISIGGGGSWPSIDAYLSTQVGGEGYHYLDQSGPLTAEMLVGSL